MLKEYSPLRQHDDGFRRLFYDDFFDLYIWYERNGGPILGFQLVYDKVEDPYSLTWLAKEGYLHNKIDDGEPGDMGAKMSPILMPDGLFDSVSVEARLQRVITTVEQPIRDFVLEKIHVFDNNMLGRVL